MSEKYNRQGVRDLNHLKGKKLGRKLDLPEEQFQELWEKDDKDTDRKSHTRIRKATNTGENNE